MRLIIVQTLLLCVSLLKENLNGWDLILKAWRGVKPVDFWQRYRCCVWLLKEDRRACIPHVDWQRGAPWYRTMYLWWFNEALLGGVHAPCSLQYFIPFSLLLSIFRCSLIFTNFHCSFFISLCSLLLFNFSSCSLIISLAPCSIIPIFCCSLLHSSNVCAPGSQITFSLLPAPFLILDHAPCSFGSQKPFSLLPDYP